MYTTLDSYRRVFSFPNSVNDISARLVAAMVIALSLAAIITERPLLFAALAYGFLARLATGPTLSPMGLLATRVIAPLLGNPSQPSPGPPKRFAQTVGLVFSGAALALLLAVDSPVAAQTALAVLTIFASLEAFLGFCAGCYVFGHLIRWGVIPESVCRECVVSPHPAAS